MDNLTQHSLRANEVADVYKRYMGGFDHYAEIPNQKMEITVENKDTKEFMVELLPEEMKELVKQGAKTANTLATLLYTIWGIILQKYTSTEDIAFERRIHQEGEDETRSIFPFRMRSKDNETISQLLERINVNERKLTQLLFSTNTVFDQVVAPHFFILKQSNSIHEYKDDFHVMHKKDLGVYAFLGQNLKLKFVFNPNVYTEEFVQSIALQYKRILFIAISSPEMLVSDVSMVSLEEKNYLLGINGNCVDFPRNQSIIGLFREQAQRSPCNTALIFERGTLSYQELDSKSDAVAHYLCSQSIGPGDRIALMNDRTPFMIISILGVLKSGAAYVPIDPAYPEERVAYMLSDSKAALMLVEEQYESITANYDISVTIINKILQNDDTVYSNELPPQDPHHEAYIIYTSGSTGKPKGILTTHSNIIKTVVNCGYIELTAEDKLLQLSNYVFDGSIFDIFGTLLNGAQLVLVPKETFLDPTQLSDLIQREQITISFMTTALFNLLVDIDIHSLKSLRKILFGGELSSIRHVQRAFEVLGEDRIIHVYGPTETTVFATYYPITSDIMKLDFVPIGRPIYNTSVYVLNNDNQLQPIGVPGELYIGGEGLARGYLNREELTEAVFVKHPFIDRERVYKTGDLVRWTRDGQLEFLGRLDNQVKIRGHRIELEEIEKSIAQHPQISQVVVLPLTDSEGHYTNLFAYYISQNKEEITNLKEYLSFELPAYMVPSQYIAMKEFPLTPNGKIDKKSFPLPVPSARTNYEAPSSETEAKLVKMWSGIFQNVSIGIHDNFFDLGGQSLNAMMLISQVKKEWGISVSIRNFFEQPTIQQLAQYIQVAHQDHSQVQIILEPCEERKYYPVSAAQRAIYTIQQLDEQGCGYNITSVHYIQGKIDHQRLEDAINSLIQRHESLHTTFHYVDGQLVQKVNPEARVRLETYSIHHLEEISDCIQSYIQPFDLEKDLLFRASLLKRGPEQYIFIMDTHHIVMDGISMNIFYKELSELYQGGVLPLNTYQFKDYSVWEDQVLQTTEYDAKAEFWQQKFSDEIPILDLPTDYSRAPQQNFEGSRSYFEMDQDLVIDLKKITDQSGTTTFMVLLAAYHVLLSKWSGQEDIIVGTAVANRNHVELNNAIGMFVNTVALRNTSNGQQTFLELLLTIKKRTLQAFEHADYPFEKVVQNLKQNRDASRNPLFDTMLIMQNMDQHELIIDGAVVEPLNVASNQSRFDLSWEFYGKQHLSFAIEYSTALFQSESISRMAEQFIFILRQITSFPQIQLLDIEVLSANQKKIILGEFNNTFQPYPEYKVAHQLFEEIVASRHNHTAIVCGERHVSYLELNQWANSLARTLRFELGVKREQFVGIMMDRSIEMVVAVLAVLKAGGAYMPIDPTYPVERIQYMLKDSRTHWLLTHLDVQVPTDYPGEVLKVELSDYKTETTSDNLPNINTAHDLAYMIYTSGSTGNPKGVMIEHQGLSNFLLTAPTLGIHEDSRVLQFAPFSFDGSVAEIFQTLLSGATLYVEKKENIISDLLHMLREKKITAAILPPSMLRAVEYKSLPHLKTITTVGEACSKELVEIWGEGRNFINGYGPTEATIGSTLGVITKHTDKITIGKPIPNKKIYIVNSNMQLQPIGVSGEIYIGGAGIARGYWNKPDLTKEKFVNNPFGEGRIYRSGDLGRWLPNGTIEFMGRIDHQVKINGHRIEMEEITETLLKHPSVLEAIVIDCQEEQHTKLAAYVVLKDDSIREELWTYLGALLPQYMIPNYIVTLSSLPLTPNLKIDRKALPDPYLGVSEAVTYVEPSNEIEALLVSIWQEILKVDRIGLLDHFIKLGGDSIKGIQIAAQLSKHHYKLDLKRLYEYPSIIELAPYVVPIRKESEQQAIIGQVQLTPIQHWFYEQGFPEDQHWNQSILLPADTIWDDKRVEKSLMKLIEHHDALRMKFIKEQNQVIQMNQGLDHKSFEFHVFHWQTEMDWEESMKKETSRLQKGMNLSEGILMQAGLFKTPEKEYLFIAVHHLVIDGVSWRILLEDLNQVYTQLEHNLEAVLPSKTDSFKEWSYALQEYASTQQFQNEFGFWENQDRFIRQQLSKNRESARRCTMQDSKVISIIFPKRITQDLLTQVHRAFNTEVNDILLSALVLTMTQCTGNPMISVSLEGHGRENIHREINISRTLGWFTSIFPVIFTLDNLEIGEVIKTVKNTLRSIPNKGIGYGIMKYICADKLTHAPSLSTGISFNYLGVFDTGTLLQGLGQSSISIGDSISPLTPMTNELEINGAVNQETLLLEFRYDPNLYANQAMNRLVETFQASLYNIIQYCMEKKEQVLTSSDFSAKGINQEELDLFLNSLN
ncbi:non-ribosomal peptide synthetase [Paenibacillus xylanexedens]|uniref:non-ribosomal peptide synthetase n=1 Tax=Paenibacillus xylanexedens TaxID=528191 RepID=UPI0011A8CDA2|nr:non-ribosomal peptide synthetase [Paenibacillus xylanexedens]